MPRRRMGAKDFASVFDARDLRGAFGSPRTSLAVYDNSTVSSTDAMAANLTRVHLLDRLQEGKRQSSCRRDVATPHRESDNDQRRL